MAYIHIRMLPILVAFTKCPSNLSLFFMFYLNDIYPSPAHGLCSPSMNFKLSYHPFWIPPSWRILGNLIYKIQHILSYIYLCMDVNLLLTRLHIFIALWNWQYFHRFSILTYLILIIPCELHIINIQIL